MRLIGEKAREEFVNLLGEENFNDGEVITNVYSYNWCQEVFNYVDGDTPTPFSEVPVAVALPSNTEEVQRIVQLCNKYEFQFKAQSTGFGPWNQPVSKNCIVVDLRRMNKIVKIDQKNLYAVVEPYVSGAQLQAELMKYNLNCHMPGAGPQVSPLASHTSMAGPGFTSPSTGHSGRNVLGVEWVLPTGEILKLGSYGLKNKPDWFNGDGPGPSLRGIMRGWAGAKSGIGIFTRVAIKLFPYPCETKYNVSGKSPNYNFEKPNYLKLYIFDCKGYKKLEKTMQLVEEHEVAFICSYMSSFALMAIFSNNVESLMKKIPLGVLKIPLLVLIAARTENEFNYKKKCMELVMNDLDLGNVVGEMFDPDPIFYAEALRSNLGYHGFIATGGFQSAGGSADSLKLVLNTISMNKPLKKQYVKEGVLANDFGEGAWGTTYEHGHYAHCEFPTMFDQTEEYSVEGMADYLENSNKMHLVENLGAPFFVEGNEMHEFFGPYMLDYHKLLRKIKETFDPNHTADSGFYIEPKKKVLHDFQKDLKKKLRRWDYDFDRKESKSDFKKLKIKPKRNIRTIGRALKMALSIIRPRKNSSKVLLLPPKKKKKIKK